MVVEEIPVGVLIEMNLPRKIQQTKSLDIYMNKTPVDSPSLCQVDWCAKIVPNGIGNFELKQLVKGKTFAFSIIKIRGADCPEQVGHCEKGETEQQLTRIRLN